MRVFMSQNWRVVNKSGTKNYLKEYFIGYNFVAYKSNESIINSSAQNGHSKSECFDPRLNSKFGFMHIIGD